MSQNKYSYKADLLERLANPAYAELYLDAAAKDSREVFLLALRDVAESQQGIGKLATDTRLNRENLYKALSQEGNPRYSTLESVLDALGMNLSVKLKSHANLTCGPSGGTETQGETAVQSVQQTIAGIPADEFYYDASGCLLSGLATTTERERPQMPIAA